VLPKLLLVENDSATRVVIRAALKKICDLDIAVDGETAIKLAGETKYPIILMDIALGYGLDGIETSKIIRLFKGYEDIPIVAVTAFAMFGDKEIFLSQGLTHYLPKPIDIRDLKKLITELLAEVNKA
jgi:two-component system, sensor histidine kinase